MRSRSGASTEIPVWKSHCVGTVVKMHLAIISGAERYGMMKYLSNPETGCRPTRRAPRAGYRTVGRIGIV